MAKEPRSNTEINDLLMIVERDLKDSKNSDLSFDWQFGIAYNAAFKLATIIVRASGLRVRAMGHHMYTINMIPQLMGLDKIDDSNYLETCRCKRNLVEYDSVGGATKEDVEELRQFVIEFRSEVILWMKKNNF